MQLSSRKKMLTFSNLNNADDTQGLMGAAKTGDLAMARFLQAVMKAWLAYDPERTDAEFHRISGLSRGAINNIKNKAEGAGRKTVDGFARAFGVETWQLYAAEHRWTKEGGHEIEPKNLITEIEPGENGARYGDLPGWREAESEARALFAEVPDVGFRLAADMRGGALPTLITARTVGELAMWAWHATGSYQDRIRAETAEVQANLDKSRKLREEGKTPPPPSSGRAKPLTARKATGN